MSLVCLLWKFTTYRLGSVASTEPRASASGCRTCETLIWLQPAASKLSGKARPIVGLGKLPEESTEISPRILISVLISRPNHWARPSESTTLPSVKPWMIFHLPAPVLRYQQTPKRLQHRLWPLTIEMRHARLLPST